jgi:uncharacterized protein (TIGR02147 family)
MNSIFTFNNYADFINEWLKNQKEKGQQKKLADKLRIHPVVISQVLSRKRDLTDEQAFASTVYMQLTKNETEYFLLLVDFAKAGEHELKKYLDKKIQEHQKDWNQAKKRVEGKSLSSEAKAVFYSDWAYSAVRLSTELPHIKTQRDIARYLDLSLDKVEVIVNFLVLHGLVEIKKNGFNLGTKNTHLDNDDPLVNIHRKNWRLKAIEKMSKTEDQDFFFSANMSVAKKDVKKIRELMLQTIEKLTKVVKDSDAEELCALNIDFFPYGEKNVEKLKK